METIQGNSALLSATELGVNLLPMDTAGGEIRFLHVDAEELEEEFETCLGILVNEISQEKGLDTASSYIQNTLQIMLDRINSVIESRNLDDLIVSFFLNKSWYFKFWYITFLCYSHGRSFFLSIFDSSSKRFSFFSPLNKIWIV